MQRRRLLRLGLGASIALGLAGGLALWWSPGLQDGRLSPAGRAVMGALARALLDGSLGEDEAALRRHLQQFEATIAGLPPAVRAELAQLLGLLANAPGRLGLLGLADLERAPRTEVAAALQALRHSRLGLRQQAYFALRELHCAAFFSQVEHWPAIGYPGPLGIQGQA